MCAHPYRILPGTMFSRTSHTDTLECTHSHPCLQAARAAEILCASSIGARAVLSSDALPAMLDLLLPPERGDASPALCVELMQPALNACWLLLHRSAAAAEEPSAARQPAEGLPPLDALLRALAAAALPQRMTAVLRTVLSAYCLKAGLNGPVGRGPGNHSRSASVPLVSPSLQGGVETHVGDLNQASRCGIHASKLLDF